MSELRNLEGDFDEVDLRGYIEVVGHWLWLIVLGAILAGVTAYIVGIQKSPVYQASTDIRIDPAGLNPTYAYLMIQRPILGSVAESVGLDLEDLIGHIKVSQIGGTELLKVTVENGSPQIAAEVANTLPQVFISSNERLAEVQSLDIDTITVFEPAEVPEFPMHSRVWSNTLLAAVVGAMLALGVIFLIEYLDDTIKTSEDVSQTLGLLTLGAITRFRSTKDGGEDGGGPIVAANPLSSISEAYRMLRTNILSNTDTSPETILVTSAEPFEGKTTTAANLAVVMAQAGFSVILVDLDLRKPDLYRFFGLEKNSLGFTNALLCEPPELQKYLQETTTKVRILTSGSPPPDPSEISGSLPMQKLIPVFKEAADVVIFDGPPVLAVTDATVMASVVDSVLLVIKAGGTRRAIAQEAKRRLAGVKAAVGVVLNFVPPPRKSYSQYYQNK